VFFARLNDILAVNGYAYPVHSTMPAIGPNNRVAGIFHSRGPLMALFLTEYSRISSDLGSNGIAAAQEPAVAEQTITVTAGSQQSEPFNAQTAFVMVHAQEAACLKWGTNPTAVTTAQRIAAGETRFVGVPAGAGFRVAVIAGAA
jgi:hypothetical protein